MSAEGRSTLATEVLQVQPELTVYQVAELQQSWRRAWDAGIEHFDLAAVTDIDGAGVQLLLSLHRSARTSRRPLHLLHAPAVVREALELIGAHDVLVQEADDGHH